MGPRTSSQNPILGFNNTYSRAASFLAPRSSSGPPPSGVSVSTGLTQHQGLQAGILRDPRSWARLAGSSTKCSSMIRNVCWKTKCYRVVPSVISDLLACSSEPAAKATPALSSSSNPKGSGGMRGSERSTRTAAAGEGS